MKTSVALRMSTWKGRTKRSFNVHFSVPDKSYCMPLRSSLPSRSMGTARAQTRGAALHLAA